MKEEIEYGFWFWSHKLKGILYMLAQLSNYNLEETEMESIKEALTGTNDELDLWAKKCFVGRQYHLDLQLAYDAEQKSEMIHIKLKTESGLKQKLEVLDLFQGMFKTLEMENETKQYNNKDE
nr:hypothetical protein [Allomuricauda sp.]